MIAKNLLTPKNKVEFLYSDMTLKEAVARLSKHRYAAVPVLERESNRYLYCISANDILRRVLQEREVEAAMGISLSAVSILRFTVPSLETTEIEALRDLAIGQNFIPIVNEQGTFLGIVTRQAILNLLIDEVHSLKGE